MMQELVGKTLGNYEIREKIGQGGMAQVFKAFQPGLERLVAVKVLPPALAEDPDFTQRFRREARSVASLNHPNIVQVYDFGVQDDYYYLVMRYVRDSKTLGSLIKAGVPLDRLLDYVIQIAEALDYAHQQGILHRDVKPGNILIDERGALLSDFGLVRIGENASDLTVSGMGIMGTPAYMSPEQALGDELDYRTDIYSLGVVVFQILTGHVPHEATTPHGILVKRSIEPAPSLRAINPNMPESLDQVVKRTLAKDPNDRYASAAEFAKALNRAQQDLYYQEVGDVTVPDPGVEPQAGLVEPAEVFTRPVARPSTDSKRPWLVILGVAVIILAGGALLFSRFLGTDNGQEDDKQVAAVAENPVETEGPDIISETSTSLPTATPAPSLPAATFTPTLPAATPTSEAQTFPVPVGMVKIPGGAYRVGLDAPGDAYVAQQAVELTEFWIDLYEVTNGEYAVFVTETGQPVPSSWVDGSLPAGQEDHPVEGVTWDQAAAYCEWAKKRLPTEAEWEVVARGAVGWLYPWGNDERAVELPRSGTYPVGSVSENRSPFGVYDMAGNTWEWVGDTYAPVTDGHRVLRGGAHGFLKDMAYRLQGDPSVPTMFATAGIRCAADRVGGS